MITTRHILPVLFPALLLVSVIFGIRALQYKHIFFDSVTQQTDNTSSALSLIPILPSDPIVGVSSAPITLVAFEDFGCEGCKSQNTLLKEIEQRYPKKVKIIWKGLPVATFPFSSEPAHEYAFCANAQGEFASFKEFAFINHSNLSKETLNIIIKELDVDPALFQACLASPAPQQHIDAVRQLAALVHVQHVPTFFLDNTQISAPSTLEEWEAVLGL